MNIYYQVQFDDGKKLAAIEPSAAEIAVAKQAEYDCRKYIPRKTGNLVNSGTVTKNQIRWSAPYARLMYYGRVKVDPKYKVGGFPKENGEFISRKGTKKVSSDRKFKYTTGQSFWFSAAKKANIKSWMRIAARRLTNG